MSIQILLQAWVETYSQRNNQTFALFQNQQSFETIQDMIVIFRFHHSGLFCRYSTLGYNLDTIGILEDLHAFQTSRIDGVLF